MSTPVNDTLISFIRQALIERDRAVVNEDESESAANGDFVRQIRKLLGVSERSERVRRGGISSQDWAALAQIVKIPPPVPNWLKNEVMNSPGARELDREVMRETIQNVLDPITPLLRVSPKSLDEARDHIDDLISNISSAIGALHAGAYRLGIALSEGHELDKYPQIEGCIECGWRGTYDELIEHSVDDQCPDCGSKDSIMTYYGDDELIEDGILKGDSKV